MCTGIKQGAIESPTLFSLVSELCVADASDRYNWGAQGDKLPGLNLRDILFMDDSVMWDSNTETLQTRANQLAVVFAEWGLDLNTKKCQWCRSPHCKQKEPLVIKGTKLESSEYLEVMGLKMSVNMSPSEMIGPLLARARDTFWSLKHLLRKKGNMKQRLYMLQTIVGGVALWCLAAIPPDKQALAMLNSVQTQFLVWMMRKGRQQGEKWLDHHIRVHREARSFPMVAEIGRIQGIEPGESIGQCRWPVLSWTVGGIYSGGTVKKPIRESVEDNCAAKKGLESKGGILSEHDGRSIGFRETINA